jgi:CheY-like chemotaxis protein
MDGDAEDILAAGIDRYMTKPLRKAAILAVIAEFCPVEARPIAVEEVQAMTGT